MASWDDILTSRDKEVFALSGFGKKAGFGQRPALLIIDVNYNFTGDKPEPILESVKRFRTSCGEEGWDGVYHIRELLTKLKQTKEDGSNLLDRTMILYGIALPIGFGLGATEHT